MIRGRTDGQRSTRYEEQHVKRGVVRQGHPICASGAVELEEEQEDLG